ncbi:class II fructose-1,6-bisphosphate aldolase [Oceanobacillus alkalisoli]|uniref:class II fructose-1,6-bisphosphate aldolase n=1 Tax=Oceanobacillus alkalisoli TaxID=2925113 RepID=UPI001EF083E0|nr:class II fructose-1,6-bisphosphate aldolase [Oceanobacillus alkalisoli]MCF3943317.1 class II fructose-1,6-bisphosphate aldolase [Oceanobacillus alkalisoli]MCG5103806.1 class II fructose-1,6-bisphosphate aldolase [Oceanobacillus alkalisoli]
MAFVSMKEMLKTAKENGYAVGQFNLNTLLWARPVLEAAEELKAPVIVASSERLVDYLGGFRIIASTVKMFIKELGITVPVALHLDHGIEVERCKAAIDAGYSSVMIDGSHYSIEENIRMTKEVVEYAQLHGVSVEAEVGTVGGTEDGLTGGIQYADPEHCERIVEETGIDALAAALGSVHGPYQGEPKLGFAEMKEISELIDIPLVLHGGTGIPREQIRKAIHYGHAKINVNTETAQAWTQTVREIVTADQDIYEVRKILDPAHGAIKQTVKSKIKEFGFK